MKKSQSVVNKMDETKRIINEPNVKVEVYCTTGRYPKNEITVGFTGNLLELSNITDEEFDKILDRISTVIALKVASALDKLKTANKES